LHLELVLTGVKLAVECVLNETVQKRVFGDIEERVLGVGEVRKGIDARFKEEG